MRIRDRVIAEPVGSVLGIVLIGVHLWWGVALWGNVDGVFDWLHQWIIRPDDARGLISFGALSKTELLVDREYWRVVSSFCVHGSLIHLALNLSALFALSPIANRLFGVRETVIGLLGSTVVGAVLSGIWGAGMISVGASGGIFGLGGAVWFALRNQHRETKDDPALDIDGARLGWALLLSLGLGWGLTQLELGFRIDQLGHIGGLIFGVCWGAVRSLVRLRPGPVVWLTLLASCLGGFGLHYANHLASDEVRVEIAVGLVERGDVDAGLRALNNVGLGELSDVQLNDAGYRLALTGFGLDVAESMVRRALVSQPSEPNFLDSIGWIECLTDRPEAGLEHLNAAAAGFGSVPEEVADHIRNCQLVGSK